MAHAPTWELLAAYFILASLLFWAVWWIEELILLVWRHLNWKRKWGR